MANWYTFLNLQDEVLDLIDESSTDLRAVVKKAINQAYRDMMVADIESPLWFRRKAATFSTVAATRAYTDQEAIGGATIGALASAGITDLGRILAMAVDGYKCEAAEQSLLLANAHEFYDDNRKTDHPRYYLHEQSFFSSQTVGLSTRTRAVLNTISFFHMPNSAKTVRLAYESAFNPLSSDSDTPQMPMEFQQALVFGGLAMLEAFDVALSRSAFYVSLYQKAREEMVQMNRKMLNWTPPRDAWAMM